MDLPPVVESVIDGAINFVYSFAPLAEKSCFLVPNIVFEKMAELAVTTGQDSETLNFVMGLFVCYPLGMVMNMIPYGKARHLFSFLLGAFLLQFTIGKQWIHHVITSLLAYGMLKVLPAKEAKFWVPVMTMVYCTLGHLHRQYVNYLGYDLDFTGSQMVLTQKLYMLAFNLYDGEMLKKGEVDRADYRATKKCAPMAVSELPPLLDYMGYCFNFSSLLAGPAFEYYSYAAACDGTHFYNKDGTLKHKVPSSFMSTLKPFVVSLLAMAWFVVGNGMVPLLDPTDPQRNTPPVLLPEMLAKPFYYRYAYTWIALMFVRGKYYFAWKNAEGANNIWHAGFDGFDEKTGSKKGWTNASNMDIFDFEFAHNIKTFSAAWNKKTAHWLAHYVYMRTGGSLAATYGMSAFWHGFYPGYYMFFLSIPIATACERIGKKKLSPRMPVGNWTWYDVLCRISVSIIIQNMIVPFQMLSGEWAWAYLKSQYFFAHIVCAVFYGVMTLIPTPKKKES